MSVGVSAFFGGAILGSYCAAQQLQCVRPRSYMPPYPSVFTNDRCFLEISQQLPRRWWGLRGGEVKKIGTLELELFNDACPRTARNFRALIRGDQGSSPCGKRLHYLGVPFHFVEPGVLLAGGDVVSANGTTGHSIYGPTFPTECNVTGKASRHCGPGLLTTASAPVRACDPRAGSVDPSSTFGITLAALPHLDGRYTTFGQVSRGFDVLEEVERIVVDAQRHQSAAPMFFVSACNSLGLEVIARPTQLPSNLWSDPTKYSSTNQRAVDSAINKIRDERSGSRS